MKPEAKWGKAIHDNLLVRGDRWDRIENSIGSGFPDTNACLSGEDVWMELKAPKEPARAATPLMTSNSNHRLLQSQINWFARQRIAGGIAFILMRTDKGRIILIDGTKHGDTFNEMTLSVMIPLALYHCPPLTRMDDNEWRMLRNVIFTAARHRRLHLHASAQQLLADVERNAMASRGDARRILSVEARPRRAAAGPARSGRGTQRHETTPGSRSRRPPGRARD